MVRFRYRHTAVASLLLLTTVAAAWLLAHEGHQPIPTRGASVDPDKGTIILSPDAQRALNVQSAPVQFRSIDEHITAPAVLVAPWTGHAYATSRIEGRITAIYAQPGQAVKAGQPLAEVQSLELENRQLELLNAVNEVRLAAENLAELEAAYRRGAVAEQQMLEARSRHQELLGNLTLARRKLTSLGIDEQFLQRLLTNQETAALRSLPIRSPIDGDVVHADVQLGQVIQPTDHLIEIVNLATVWVRIAVLERDWHRTEVGQPVEVRLAAYPREVFRSRVEVKGLALDPETRQGIVWASLPAEAAAGPRLLPGMYGQASFILSGTRKMLTVPADALIRDGAERYVLRVDGPGEYRRCRVVVGRTGVGIVEIHSPEINPDDHIVTVGSHELAALFSQGVLRPSKEAEQNIGLRVEAAKRRVLDQVVQPTGSVDLWPGRRAVVAARLPGTIEAILVDRSQAVQAGTVVARVASVELETLQTELLRQHFQVQTLEQTLQRLQTLGDKGNLALSRRQLREAESAARVARHRRDSLERRLEAIGLSPEQVRAITRQQQFVDSLPIRAPIDGVVVNFPARLGQFIKAEDPILEIHDLNRPVIRGHLSELEFRRVAVGQPARVRLAADPGFLAEGRIVRTGQVFGSTDRTLSVWIELPAPPAQLLLFGMLARPTLVVGQTRPVLAVRREAVVRTGSRTYVFVQQSDGVFVRREVETGTGDDRYIEISRGLQQGEFVAVQGAGELATAYASLK